MYYVYRHIRLDKNEPFYIGLGETIPNVTIFEKEYSRAYSHASRSLYWKRIVKKSKYDIDIIFEHESFDLIKQKEIEFIKLYGRKNLNLGSLCNLTDGGDGTIGYHPTKKTIDNLKKAAQRKFKNGYKIKGKPIFQYCPDTGKFLKKWETISEASKSISVDKSTLASLIKDCNNNNFCKGFLWYEKYKGDYVLSISGRTQIRNRVILMIDKETHEVLNSFNSNTLAFNFLGKRSSGRIDLACRQPHRIAFGYKWRYKNE